MKLVKNYFYNVGYQVFILIVPLITTPYITRVLGSEGVGINAYTNSIIQYFILLGSIGIGLYGNRTIAYVRDDKQKMSQNFWEISILRFITIGIAYAAFLIFLIFTKQYQQFYLYQSVQIIAAAFDISWLFMGIENFQRTVLRNFFIKTLSVIAIFVFVKNSHDVGAYILVLTISTLIGNVSLWGYLRKTVSKPNFSQLNLIGHIRPSVGLFVPQIATQIYLVLNKTMLGSIDGVQSAGFYENSDKMVKMVLAVVTATGTVMLPRMAHTFAAHDYEKLHQYLYTSFDFVSFISVPMAFGLSAIAPKLATWFMGPEFAVTGNLIAVLSIVIVLIAWSNVLGTQYLLPTNQTRQYTASVTAGAIVNLLLNIWLILQYHVMGAVIATVLSEVAVTGLQLYFIRNQLKISKLFYGIWKYFVAGIIMYFAISYLNEIQGASFTNFAVQIIIGIFIYFILTVILNAPFIHVIRGFIKNKK
ncbi:polysaccharide biosynthesis C-terminal domain-containing protein [Lentilactobacillus senioris]|uniref:oligosaccharide flippase family protein n=1 Tax=Lentilactobacillus senioris TaxID=931534 RepID=UPI002282CEFE|nr:polysaccharide biosynthesis C-terminal domain-containing protein [Lentilactobacillus senioris]MCY9805998.1 polysaccharide biosynthesis C-terminal domain-containing protein [Lentilactobacillus senioris]